MYRKKNICIISVCIFTIFFTLTFYFLNSINHENITKKIKISTTPYSIDIIEHEIKIKTINLSNEYKKKASTVDPIIKSFKENVIVRDTSLSLNKLWQEFNKEINNNQIYNINNTNLGNLIYALRTTKILHADVYSKGTQLKLILTLEGGHLAIFKPQWYEKNKIILGNVYAGKDRIGSEVLAFYLSGILNLPLVPIIAERSLDIKQEILPVTSVLLNATKFEYKDQICIYGKCYYCKREDPVCTNDQGKINGVVLYLIPGKFQSYNSPWQRTYKQGKLAKWETYENYCSIVRTKISNRRLLDLIDVSIFDFLIQNGDRHHYEVLYDKVVLIDNGKGLGNPFVHHLDILAPLYQCCELRKSTWERLKLFSGGLISEILQSFPEITNTVSTKHFKAIEERLEMIYAAVEVCKSQNKMLLY